MSSPQLSQPGRYHPKLREKCAVLADMILKLKPIHSCESTTPAQLQLLETVVGAAIWYLPRVPQLWTGKASIAAVHLLESGDYKGVSKDHQTPRKVAARMLLKLSDPELTAENIERLYLEDIGHFNLVTKAENRALMRYQRAHVFASPQQSYADAGIQLVDAAQLQMARKRAAVLKIKTRSVEEYPS